MTINAYNPAKPVLEQITLLPDSGKVVGIEFTETASVAFTPLDMLGNEIQISRGTRLAGFRSSEEQPAMISPIYQLVFTIKVLKNVSLKTLDDRSYLREFNYFYYKDEKALQYAVTTLFQTIQKSTQKSAS